MSELLNEGGYPTEATLKTIRGWKLDHDPRSMQASELLCFIERAWNQTYGTIKRVGPYVECVTGGWSGNEDIIEALEKNNYASTFLWEATFRGGLHVLRDPSLYRLGDAYFDCTSYGRSADGREREIRVELQRLADQVQGLASSIRDMYPPVSRQTVYRPDSSLTGPQNIGTVSPKT